jgi:hypothetical protein
MKKIVTFLLILTLLAIATPAAADKNEPVGERINVLHGYPTTYQAGVPFHIHHGWQILSNTDAIGIYDFDLEIDGVWVEEDFISRWVESGDPDTLHRGWWYNFADGMTGTHTFVGHWIGPCQPLVDVGEYSGPCTKPNEKVEITRTLTVTFTP